jgi:hypothetical protein
LQQISDSPKGVWDLENAYTLSVENCNFVNCSVQSFSGAFIYIELFFDSSSSNFKNLFIVQGQGKYFIYFANISNKIFIDDNIYVYSFSFDTTNINWNNSLIILTSPLTIDFSSNLTR